jgi:hypothetical protein
VFVLVINEDDDQVFLQRVLHEAVDFKRPVLSVPYAVTKHSEGGMGYSAALTSNMSTVCFTDWLGEGLHEVI